MKKHAPLKRFLANTATVLLILGLAACEESATGFVSHARYLHGLNVRLEPEPKDNWSPLLANARGDAAVVTGRSRGCRLRDPDADNDGRRRQLYVVAGEWLATDGPESVEGRRHHRQTWPASRSSRSGSRAMVFSLVRGWA